MARRKIDDKLYNQIKVFLRFYPKLQDVIDYFEIPSASLRREIKRRDKCTFEQLRLQCIVKSRYQLVSKAFELALKKDDTKILLYLMDRFCKDIAYSPIESSVQDDAKVEVKVEDIVNMAMKAREQKIETDNKNKKRINK